MYDVLDHTVPHLPVDKPTYLMGVGTPENILEAVDRGIDFFDCVYPSRNGRHGNLYTKSGTLHIKSARYAEDDRPIEEDCGCPVCRGGYSRAYLRHLYKAQEMLGMRMGVLHNLYYYNHLMEQIRSALDRGEFAAFKKAAIDQMHEGES
jgi:queuine tRNA-ribosyltransferase